MGTSWSFWAKAIGGKLGTGKIPQLPGHCHDFPLMFACKNDTFGSFSSCNWGGVSCTGKLPQLPAYT